MDKLKKYLITILIGLVFAFLIAYTRGVFEQETKKDVFHVLCDSLFIPGVLLAGFGGLIFVSNEGAFDGLTFALSSFFKMFSAKGHERPKSYKDYKDEKGKKKTPMAYILLSGLFLLVLSIIMFIVYSNL